MDRLAWTALSRVNEDSVVRRRLTNELTNVQTIGFKRSYETALRTLKSKGPGFDSRFQAYAFPIDYVALEEGPMLSTGRKMDIAMRKQTVLGVRSPNGDLAFTRRGDLKASSSGLLVNGSDHPVFGQNGTIQIPLGVDIEITEDGSIFARDPLGAPEDPPLLIDQLFLRDASETRIIRREDGLLKPSPEDARPNGDISEGTIPKSVQPGTLEGANSSAIDSMIAIIDHSRAFESQIRIIKEAKAIDETASSMLKTAR